MKVKGETVATVMDAIPTDRLCQIYDLADRAVEFWAEQAKMVQLCHDAGFGSWKRLRSLTPKQLEAETQQAVFVLAQRARRTMVPHLDDIQRAEVQRKKAVLEAVAAATADPKSIRIVCQNTVAAAPKGWASVETSVETSVEEQIEALV